MTALLALSGVASIVTVWLIVLEIGLADRAKEGVFVPLDEVLRFEDRRQAVGWISVGLFVVTLVVWLIWQHRCHANLHAWRVPRLQFSPASSVVWWLIPIANLAMPFETVKELWGASGNGSWSPRMHAWPVIGCWWGSLIASLVAAGFAAGATDDEGAGIEAFVAGDQLLVVSESLQVLAVIFAIAVARSVVKRQLGRGAPIPVPPPPPPRPEMPEGPAVTTP